MARTAGPKSPIQPISQVSTPALIAARLREAIATGVFEPGEQLAESSLAASFGVSRGPLREAMQRLTQEGLLISHRNRGLFVVDLDDAEIRDIYLVRAALEKTAISEILTQGHSAAARSLFDITAQMDDAESVNASDADMRFHTALIELSGSPRLQSMHSSLITQLRTCLRRMETTYGKPGVRAAEHEAIVQAVLDQDGSLAHRLVDEHMRDGLRRLGVRDAR